MLALILCLVMLIFLYELGRGLTRGEIGWGKARRVRAEQPREFWGQIAFAFFFALAIGASLFWYFGHGTWPELPLLHLVNAILFSTIIIRALAGGRASVGSVSFDRLEEPREFWILCALGLLFLALLWMTLLLKAWDVLSS